MRLYYRKHSEKQQGFSLIELSILMTVLALIAVGSLSWLAPSAKDEVAKIRLTQERMDRIQSALRAFRVRQGYIPCAANPSLTDADADFGASDCSDWDGAATGWDDNNYGMVPTRTLGISPELSVDAWGRRFTYHVARVICDFDSGLGCNAATYSSQSGDTTVLDGFLRVWGIDPSAPAMNPSSGRLISWEVAYVLLSHGVNGVGAYMPSGATKGEPAGFDLARPKEAWNRGLGPSGNIEENRATYFVDILSNNFDDFVRFETQNQLDTRTMDIDTRLLSEAECLNISTAIGQYDDNTRDDVDAQFSVFSGDASDTILSILWHAQAMCVRMYPGQYPDPDDIQCPNQIAGGNRQFNRTLIEASAELNDLDSIIGNYGACECTGSTTWNAGNGECS